MSAGLQSRWDEINRNLAELSAAGADESHEAHDLLGELDRLEFEAGETYLAEQRKVRGTSETLPSLTTPRAREVQSWLLELFHALLRGDREGSKRIRQNLRRLGHYGGLPGDLRERLAERRADGAE